MNILSLKNQKQFDFVSKHSSKICGSYFILIVSPRIPFNVQSEVYSVFFGMKVSRKFSKKAVIRNKARRRIRHIVSLLAKNIPDYVSNKSIIIIPRIGFNEQCFSKIYENLKKCFFKVSKDFGT